MINHIEKVNYIYIYIYFKEKTNAKTQPYRPQDFLAPRLNLSTEKLPKNLQTPEL